MTVLPKFDITQIKISVILVGPCLNMRYLIGQFSIHIMFPIYFRIVLYVTLQLQKTVNSVQIVFDTRIQKARKNHQN
jgi:hypothetical protein